MSVRSADLNESELIYLCPLEGCDRKYGGARSINIHLRRSHGILKDYSPKILDGQIECSNCKKVFQNTKSLRAHGSPEVCAQRMAKNYSDLICEHCGSVWNQYIGRASGKATRFCSTECASAARTLPLVNKQCRGCGVVFELSSNSRQVYCTGVCYKLNGSGYKIEDSSNMGGPRSGGGFSKQLEYVSKVSGESMKLNLQEIELAEYLDTLGIDWSRNSTIGFNYTDLEGNTRKFYPDFALSEYGVYVEYKGWLTDEMRHKMKLAQELNPGLKLIIVVGRDKRFFKDGIRIEALLDGSIDLV